MGDRQGQRQQAPRIEQRKLLCDHASETLANKMIVLPFELVVKQSKDVFGHTTGGGEFGRAIAAAVASIVKKKDLIALLRVSYEVLHLMLPCKHACLQS